MGIFSRPALKEPERHKAEWPAADERIEQLAQQSTPLNDHFAEGYAVHNSMLMHYIAALERRIARLESTNE
jgi:hypothetical protein